MIVIFVYFAQDNIGSGSSRDILSCCQIQKAKDSIEIVRSALRAPYLGICGTLFVFLADAKGLQTLTYAMSWNQRKHLNKYEKNKEYTNSVWTTYCTIWFNKVFWPLL